MVGVPSTAPSPLPMPRGLQRLRRLQPSLALPTGGFGVGEGEASLGHPCCVSLVLLGTQARQVAEGEESFTLQVVGPQRVVVKHSQQQTGPLLLALLRGDQAAGGGMWETTTCHPLHPKIQPSLQGSERLPQDVVPHHTDPNHFKAQGSSTASPQAARPRCLGWPYPSSHHGTPQLSPTGLQR